MPNVPISKSVTRRTVWAKTDGKCWYCGIQTNPWGDFCIDHLQPLSLRGSDELENLVPCCSSCNNRKKNRAVEQFRAFMVRQGGAYFSPEQVAYLQEKGVALPTPDRHSFYYETMDLKP